jgi:hypothetical protein
MDRSYCAQFVKFIRERFSYSQISKTPANASWKQSPFLWARFSPIAWPFLLAGHHKTTVICRSAGKMQI